MIRALLKKIITLYYIFRQLKKEERFRILFKKVGVILKKMNGFLRKIGESSKTRFGKSTWKGFWNLFRKIFKKKVA
jgi:hypothetical protein